LHHDPVIYSKSKKSLKAIQKEQKTSRFGTFTGDDPKVAAECLEQLLKSNERDTMTMAQLVLAYARSEAKVAEILQIYKIN